MKDEHQIRIEALKLTFQVGGLIPSARPEIAHQFEQYILNGYTGQAKPVAQAAEVVPETDGKDRPKRRGKSASTAPASTGEASDKDIEDETDESDLGRPSTRVAGGFAP